MLGLKIVIITSLKLCQCNTSIYVMQCRFDSPVTWYIINQETVKSWQSQCSRPVQQ